VEVYRVGRNLDKIGILADSRHDRNGDFTGIVSMPRHEVVAVATKFGVVRLYAWPSGTIVGEVHTGLRNVWQATASSDGHFLAVGCNAGLSSPGAISLWRLWPSTRPLADAAPGDLAQIEAAVADPQVQPQRPALEALAALLRHRFRHEVQVGEPSSATRPAGPHDVELG
jgi:hypothetical protein